MKGILPSNIKAMEDPDLLQDEDLDSLVLRYNTFGLDTLKPEYELWKTRWRRHTGNGK